MYSDYNRYFNTDLDYLKFFKQEGKKIIIFGCGSGGQKLCRKLKENEIEVIGICDNNEKRVGEKLEGIPIISFKELAQYGSNPYLIVIASVYENEIKVQLYENGIFNFISKNNIDFGGGGEYYDEFYFEKQKKSGILAGEIKKVLFDEFIEKNDTVIDFGCGSASLLRAFRCKRKIGVEINDIAREYSKEQGIELYKYTREVEDSVADVIVSCGVLEHVESPMYEIKELRKKLKDNGKAVFYVPCEDIAQRYERNNFDNHFYSWNSMLLGNLFKAAGYFVHRIDILPNQWPNNYEALIPKVGIDIFRELSAIRGKAWEENNLRIVAYK